MYNPRLLPILNRSNLAVIHANLTMADPMNQELNLILPERTLRSLQVELVFPQSFENLFQMSLMIFHHLVVDHYVIQIYHNRFIQEWSQHIVHQCTKSCRGVAQPKRHNEKFKIPIPHHTLHLVLVTFCDPHLILPLP